MTLIFFDPVFQEKIWGGNRLPKLFDRKLENDHIGEVWAISGHPNGVSKVRQPEVYSGLGLDELYKQHPHLFGYPQDEKFPLLVKLLDAKQDLSVQVHPDNEYAQKHEGPGELGKTECWYILEAEEGAEIIYGHTAENKDEFSTKIKQGKWQELLRRIPVKKGDFFYVPHGTIHAIGAGTLILEVQQSSDTTYRVYDYQRKDAQGNTRDLHLQASMDVAMIPHRDPLSQITSENIQGLTQTHYITNSYFSVTSYKGKDMDLSNLLAQNYYLMTITDGQGDILSEDQSVSVKKGDSFIIPYGPKKIKFRGELEVMATHIPEKESME